MMRITFLAPHVYDGSGGGRVVSIYAARLQARGHKVTLVAAPYPKPTLRQRLRELRHGKRPLVEGFSRLGNTSYEVCVSATRPPRPEDLPDADVVIATWWETAEWMAMMPATKGAHVLFVQHYETFGTDHPEKVDRVLAAPSFKITISNWLGTMLRDRFHNQHVVTIPNSVDAGQFNAPPRRRNEKPVIGMLYHTAPFKAVAVGLKAFDLLRQRMPDAQLVAFGGLPEHPDLPLPQGTRFTVLPAQDEIRDIYAACDIWLCPSRLEGFGLPLLESMACRCVAVSTPVGGPVDFLEEGRNGYFVPYDDPVTMADTLERILKAPETEWKRVSDAAHETAIRYSWDDATSRFELALESAIASAETARRRA